MKLVVIGCLLARPLPPSVDYIIDIPAGIKW
jgi:hypothetical protein